MQSLSCSRRARYGSINLGHSAEIDFEILAYPYPGKSAKTSLWRPTEPGSPSAKKLIAPIRPGVEETLAAFSPTKALSRLDLPTFDRPRKAISGTCVAGNCPASIAESKNCVW